MNDNQQDDNLYPAMKDEADRENPTADDRDPDLENDNERMFHPDQVSRLAEDGARPAEEAHDVPGSQLPIDHPQTDSNVDSSEIYDEGIGNASETNANHFESGRIEPVVDDEG